MEGEMKDHPEESLFSVDLDAIQQFICKRADVVKQTFNYYYRVNPNFVNFTLLLYGLSFLLIFPLLCHNLPYSIYWMGQDNKEIVKQVSTNNHERFVAASNYIRSIKSHTDTPNPVLTISVVTVRRTMGHRPLGYLTQVIAKLHQLTTSSTHLFSSVRLMICDTNAGPGPHTEAEALQQDFTRKQRFPESNPAAVIMDSFEKEKEDYMFCLQQSLENNPSYILLLEDDAVPQDNLLHVIHYLLTVISERHQQWSFMKFYYPERWQGYSFTTESLLELLSCGVISGCTFLFFHYHCSNHYISRSNKLKSAAFLLGFLFAILCCLAIGRSHLLELKRVSVSTHSLRPAPDCCSPGILYPVQSAVELVEMLNRTVCHHNYALDMAIASFAKTRGQRTYLVEPNLVKHIGLVSTLKGVSNVPWDFL